MDPDQIKHLEFVQAVITRMNANSFQIKGWSVTILAAFSAVYASTKNEMFVLVALVPTAIFWVLDAFYHMQERKFRGLYADVSGVSENPKNIKPFEMRPDLYTKGDYSFGSAFMSGATSFLYLPLLVMIIAFYFYFSNCE